MFLLARSLANFSLFKAFKWNPAKVMNYQANPNFPNSTENIYNSVGSVLNLLQLKEGERL